jgi:hypothetical protein
VKNRKVAFMAINFCGKCVQHLTTKPSLHKCEKSQPNNKAPIDGEPSDPSPKGSPNSGEPNKLSSQVDIATVAPKAKPSQEAKEDPVIVAETSPAASSIEQNDDTIVEWSYEDGQPKLDTTPDGGKEAIDTSFSECCTKVDNPPLATTTTTTTTTTTAVRATKEQIASAKTATNSTQVSSRPSTRSNSQPSESSEAPYTPEQRRKTDRGRGRGGKSSQ